MAGSIKWSSIVNKRKKNNKEEHESKEITQLQKKRVENRVTNLEKKESRKEK